MDSLNHDKGTTVDSNVKSKLQKLIQNDQQKVEQANEVAEQRKQRQAAFLTDFVRTDAAKISLVFSEARILRTMSGTSIPHFTVRCDKALPKAQFHTSTIAPNDGGSGGG